jgi:hypothetical protein
VVHSLAGHNNEDFNTKENYQPSREATEADDNRFPTCTAVPQKFDSSFSTQISWDEYHEIEDPPASTNLRGSWGDLLNHKIKEIYPLCSFNFTYVPGANVWSYKGICASSSSSKVGVGCEVFRRFIVRERPVKSQDIVNLLLKSPCSFTVDTWRLIRIVKCVLQPLTNASWQELTDNKLLPKLCLKK